MCSCKIGEAAVHDPADSDTILYNEGVNSNNFYTQNAKVQAFWRTFFTTLIMSEQ